MRALRRFALLAATASPLLLLGLGSTADERATSRFQHSGRMPVEETAAITQADFFSEAPTGFDNRSNGFLRQGPGDQQAPIPPAPPRRLVPAKPRPEMADKTSLLELNDRVCRWPMGHPGEADFHFCGEKVNPGFPYCVEHCGRAYQAQLPRGARRPPPPLPFGGPRVR